jgi:hypothetical protein
VLATLRGTTASQRFTATALARGVAKLLVVSGDAQTGVVGTTLPQAFGVRALDVLGNSLSGVRVDFSAATTGGSVTVVNGLTDPTGLAQTQITLGPTPGAYQYTATAGKVSVTVTETAKLTGGVGLVVPGGSP